MTTIQEHITIPEDRRVTVELRLPASLPAGEANMVVTISPNRKVRPGTTLESLAGSLAGSKTLAGDAVALVRQWRDEWEEPGPGEKTP